MSDAYDAHDRHVNVGGTSGGIDVADQAREYSSQSREMSKIVSSPGMSIAIIAAVGSLAARASSAAGHHRAVTGVNISSPPSHRK